MPRHKHKLSAEINMVPFIDIVLVMLVVFMIAAPVIMQGIHVKLPESINSALRVDKNDDLLVISIKENGDYFINIGKQESNSVSVENMIEKIKKIHTRSPDIKILIKGDSAVSYGKIIMAMSGLQSAGVTNVGLITKPGEKEK